MTLPEHNIEALTGSQEQFETLVREHLRQAVRVVVLQEIERRQNEYECLHLFRLSNHSEQLSNEGHLTSHVSLGHILQLPLAYHIHDLKPL